MVRPCHSPYSFNGCISVAICIAYHYIRTICTRQNYQLPKQGKISVILFQFTLLVPSTTFKNYLGLDMQSSSNRSFVRHSYFNKLDAHSRHLSQQQTNHKYIRRRRTIQALLHVRLA